MTKEDLEECMQSMKEARERGRKKLSEMRGVLREMLCYLQVRPSTVNLDSIINYVTEHYAAHDEVVVKHVNKKHHDSTKGVKTYAKSLLKLCRCNVLSEARYEEAKKRLGSKSRQAMRELRNKRSRKIAGKKNGI